MYTLLTYKRNFTYLEKVISVGIEGVTEFQIIKILHVIFHKENFSLLKFSKIADATYFCMCYTSEKLKFFCKKKNSYEK